MEVLLKSQPIKTNKKKTVLRSGDYTRIKIGLTTYFRDIDVECWCMYLKSFLTKF